jgi:hypothetical protein
MGQSRSRSRKIRQSSFGVADSLRSTVKRPLDQRSTRSTDPDDRRAPPRSHSHHRVVHVGVADGTCHGRQSGRTARNPLSITAGESRGTQAGGAHAGHQSSLNKRGAEHLGEREEKSDSDSDSDIDHNNAPCSQSTMTACTNQHVSYRAHGLLQPTSSPVSPRTCPSRAPGSIMNVPMAGRPAVRHSWIRRWLAGMAMAMAMEVIVDRGVGSV